MSRLFIGHKPGVGGVVKVMASDLDDPLTTPNNEHEKFLFNSETEKIGYLKLVETFGPRGDLARNTMEYDPPGTDESDCERIALRWYYIDPPGYTYHHIFPYRILNRNYPVVTEYRREAALGEKIDGPVLDVYVRWGSVNSIHISTTYRCKLINQLHKPHSNPDVAPQLEVTPDGVFGVSIETVGDAGTSSDTPIKFMAFDLPADDTAMPVPTAGAAGSRNTIISPSLVRIGHGGVDVDAPADGDLIIDSDLVPMKVARAGQVDINAGQSADILSPVTLTKSAYLDYMAWENAEPLDVPYFPKQALLQTNDWRIRYAIFADRVTIYNDGTRDVSVRYAICFDDGEESTGGSEVFLQLPDGHHQIKRPGSSDVAPKSRDILLDTRLAYLPIVKEGWLHKSEFNESPIDDYYGDRAKTVTWDNPTGFLPFLKYYVTREAGGTQDSTIYNTGWISHPYSKLIFGHGSWNFKQGRDGCTCRLTDTSAKFHLALDHPYRIDNTDQPVPSTNWSNRNRPIGIRYFVFAIPPAL